MFFNYDTKLFISFHITRRITSYTRNRHSNLGLHNRLLTNHPMTYVNQGEVITAIGTKSHEQSGKIIGGIIGHTMKEGGLTLRKKCGREVKP
jgi:hypothetical protein